MDTIKRLNENLSKLDETRKSALGFLSELTDDKSFVETGAFTSGTTFEDGVEALGEGIITGYATVFGIPVYLFVQNFEAMRGSFSSAQATKIKNVMGASCVYCAFRAVMDAAVKNGVPFVSVIDSAGARLDEGAKVLEGYAKIIRLAASMKNEVPHVAVIRGAATGLMDVFANVADVVIFGTDGYASLAAPSAVLAKDGKNPSDAKKYLGKDAAEKSGVAALEYADVATLKNQIASVLTFLSGESKIADNPNKVAKKVESVSDAVGAICDNGSALEISRNDAATKTYFAYADGAPVGVLSVEGELTCKDFRKIKRFVNLLDAYNIPLVSVVDSDGFAARLKCEEKGVAKIAAEAYTAMALSENPKIAVIKNAIGGAYALLAAKEIGFNYTIAFSDATIAPLSSDQAVNFYDEKLSDNPQQDKEELKAKYTFAEGNPFKAAKDGYIDAVIDAREVKPYVASALSMLL